GHPRFVGADTMDLWIATTRADLDALLPRIDLLILNDSEAREMTKETSLIKAGRRIRKLGPSYVAIKKGEHGALLFGEDEFFSCGAYPLEDIHDPTGAGDTFAGGTAGYRAGTRDSRSVGLKHEWPFATFVALVQRRKKSAPVKIRTSNLLIRSQMLYPVELRALRAG